MLLLENVETIYLDIVLALSEVNMRVEDGKIVVLLGNNGSGKSTVLKTISGVLKIEDGKLNTGKVEMDGRRIDRLIPEQIARLGLCHVLQGHPVFDELTAEENLQMGAFLQKERGRIKGDLEQVYAYFPPLEKLARKKAGYLSGGEQQMLVIGRALMGHPRYMLLDEPSVGLAPKVVADIFQVIRKINQEKKTTFLIAEQNAFAVLPIADYGYVLQTGKLVLEGSAQQLRDHQDVNRSYLGASGGNQGQNYYSYIRQKRDSPRE